MKSTNTQDTQSTPCCGPECCNEKQTGQTATEVTTAVREKYGETARSGLSTKQDGVSAVAEAFGYSPDELSSIPAEANMGLSCGNPTATANLRPGEVVVDLGSGGGLDVFLSAAKVGPAGKAIGIDMTPEMIELARNNAAKARLTNVEFHLANIDRMPLEDNSADVVISNCVINLAPDKPAVLREIVRVLKPGGRVAISDIALKRPLPDEIAKDLMAYVGCIAGALLIEDYRRQLIEAGLSNVVVVDAGADLNAYTKVEGQVGCCSPATSVKLPLSSACCSNQSAPTSAGAQCCGTSKAPQSVHGGLSGLLGRYDVNQYAASVKIYAIKPA